MVEAEYEACVYFEGASKTQRPCHSYFFFLALPSKDKKVKLSFGSAQSDNLSPLWEI